MPPPRGDEGELFRRHARRLERSVASLVPFAPPWIVEETCAHAFEQLCRCQPERRHVFAWLRVVAYHEALRLSRKKAIERSLEAELAVRHGETQTAAPLDRIPALADPHDIETAIEAREALRALAGLRRRQRRVVTLKAAGYSYKEIASMLGVTYTNVNRHLSEGRAELRRAA